MGFQKLQEAIAQLIRVKGDSAEDARRRLGERLRKGDLWPLRWGDPPLLSTGGLAMPTDSPPRQWSSAEIAEIDWDAGTAVDRSEFSPPGGRRRCLLLPTAEIFFEDVERYEKQAAEDTRLARVERQRRAAWLVACESVWEQERSKPIALRQWFRFGELGDELARDPRTLAIDDEVSARVISELLAWVRRQEFDLAAGDTARLSGDPPSLEPLAPLGPLTILPDPPRLMLRREAVRRFIAANPGLPGANALLRWFEPGAPTAGRSTPNNAGSKPGPKPELRQRVTKQMLNDLQSEQQSASGLKSEKLTVLGARYGCSPNTAKVARQDAISALQNSPN
jgi:hypothetical protein